MKKFTEIEISQLQTKGIELESIKKLENTLKWYDKIIPELHIPIQFNDILQINNLKELINENDIIFGVHFSKLLRAIIINKIKEIESNQKLLFDLFCYSTLINVPHKYNGCTFYYYTFIHYDYMKVYSLDNFYRVIKISNIPINSICEASKQTIVEDDKEIHYEIVKYEKDNIKTNLYMYGIENEADIQKLDYVLKKFEINQIKNSKELVQGHALKKWYFALGIIVIIIIFKILQ